jgi:hypothetical protein
MTTLVDANSTAYAVQMEIGGAASAGMAVCGRGTVATEAGM